MRSLSMNHQLRKAVQLFVGFFVFSLCFNFVHAAVPPTGDSGWGHGHRHGGVTRVAEPAAILLLGSGLVSLAIYAKKKRDKK
jgi:hypothetical protein